MLSFGFTHFLINGLLLVAYLKIICCSEMYYKPYLRTSEQSLITWNYMDHGKTQKTTGGSWLPIYLRFILTFLYAVP